MDIKKLAESLLAIAEAAAPVVGLGNEVAAAKKLVGAITDTILMVKDDMNTDDQLSLQASLAALHAKVDAHATATANSLG